MATISHLCPALRRNNLHIRLIKEINLFNRVWFLLLVPARIPELKFRFSNEIPVECAHAAVCAQLCYFESKQAPLKHGEAAVPLARENKIHRPGRLKFPFRNKMFFSTTFWPGTGTLRGDDESQMEYTFPRINYYIINLRRLPHQVFQTSTEFH